MDCQRPLFAAGDDLRTQPFDDDATLSRCAADQDRARGGGKMRATQASLQSDCAMRDKNQRIPALTLVAALKQYSKMGRVIVEIVCLADAVRADEFPVSATPSRLIDNDRH